MKWREQMFATCFLILWCLSADDPVPVSEERALPHRDRAGAAA